MKRWGWNVGNDDVTINTTDAISYDGSNKYCANGSKVEDMLNGYCVGNRKMYGKIKTDPSV